MSARHVAVALAFMAGCATRPNPAGVRPSVDRAPAGVSRSGASQSNDSAREGALIAVMLDPASTCAQLWDASYFLGLIFPRSTMRFAALRARLRLDLRNTLREQLHGWCGLNNHGGWSSETPRALVDLEAMELYVDERRRFKQEK